MSLIDETNANTELLKMMLELDEDIVGGTIAAWNAQQPEPDVVIALFMQLCRDYSPVTITSPERLIAAATDILQAEIT